MLTVDLDRLRVGPRDVLLDLGCGAGRHAFAALRRGARVIALDADPNELESVHATVTAMTEAGEVPPDGRCVEVRGDALRLPLPDASIDRIIAAEVMEHIPDDEAAMAELARVLRPGGLLAVTVPTRFPERINWALDENYYRTPGGHVRIYRRRELEGRLRRAGLTVHGHDHAHALHSPYWWIRCAGGVNRPDRLIARRYHDLLVWQIMKNPPVLRRIDRVLNPVIGKSLVVYASKPAWS
jgi:SAM-dependent methyltransferase